MSASSFLPLPELETVVGVARIVFGSIFLAKLVVSYGARRLVWAHRTPFQSTSPKLFDALLCGLIATVTCFTLGLFTGPVSLVMWVLYVALYRYASLFGLEDVAFQHLTFYFIFSGAGAALSLDSFFATGFWGRIPAGTLLPELALAIALGFVLLTAGVQKLKSPMWQQGLGSYYFFLLPQFRRLDTSFITGSRVISAFMNWIAVVMELFFLPIVLLNIYPFGLLFWVLAFGFTAQLASIFVLTWIGEAMSLGMLIVLWLLLRVDNDSLLSAWSAQHSLVDSILEQGVVALFVLSFVASAITTFVPVSFARDTAIKPLKQLYIAARYISRFTWGLLPLSVFTELHLEGPVVYRTFAVDRSGTRREVFKIFSEGCRPGPRRNFKPAFFEVTSYKVAEACMELDRFGAIQTPAREEFIKRLAQYLIEKDVPKTERNALTGLVICLKQIVAPASFSGACATYNDAPWKDALAIDIAPDGSLTVRALAKPILEHATGRDISRVSFAFNPLGV